MAKIVSARGMLALKSDDAASLTDHYGTIIEILESTEMKRRALERVRALNPDLKEIDVDIRVAQIKGSAILNILVTGNEPKFTRIYLDALLDEFMGWQREMADRMEASDPNKPLLAAILERASAASENVEDWKLPILFGAIGGGAIGALLGLLLALIIVRRPKAV